ncbi:hypothetical protein HDU67_005456, partial [Dinochytrium kinnereticum]
MEEPSKVADAAARTKEVPCTQSEVGWGGGAGEVAAAAADAAGTNSNALQPHPAIQGFHEDDCTVNAPEVREDGTAGKGTSLTKDTHTQTTAATAEDVHTQNYNKAAQTSA